MRSLFREKSEVQRILDELRDLATRYTIDDLVSGEWLVTFLGDVLEPYSKEVDEEYFKRMYSTRTPDQIVVRLIERAQRYAAIEGALTAGAYTAAVAALIGSGGAATLVTLPASVVAFVTDLLFTTRLQLHLAYDISVLYRQPVDLDDPDDVRLVLRVALGGRPGDDPAPDKVDEDGVADSARRAVETMARETAKVSRRALSIMGKQLLRRALVKLTLPVASIPLASAMNYYAAGRTARRAQGIYRDRAAIRELGPKIATAGASEPLLLVEALWLVLHADDKRGSDEAWLLGELADSLRATEVGSEAAAALKGLKAVKTDDVIQRLWKAPKDVRVGIYEAVKEAALLDHEISRAEAKVLRKLERACKR